MNSNSPQLSAEVLERVLGYIPPTAEGAPLELLPPSQLLEAYLAELELNGARRSYVQDLRNRLRAALRALGAIDAPTCDSIGQAQLSALRIAMRRGGLSLRHINATAAAVARLLAWGAERRHVRPSQVFRLRPIRIPDDERRIRRRVPSEADLGAYLEAHRAADAAACGPARKVAAMPLAPFFRLLLETGARFGEARALRWNVIDLEARELRLTAATTKGRRERALPISEPLAEELAKLRERQLAARDCFRDGIARAADPVFLARKPQPRGRLIARPVGHRTALRAHVEACELAGVPFLDQDGTRFDIHALRYAFAVRAVELGQVPLALVSEMLGHRSAELTRGVYLKHRRSAVVLAARAVPPIGGPRPQAG